MKLPGFKLVLACLVLVTCCSAAFSSVANELSTRLAGVTEQVRKETFSQVVDSANQYFDRRAGVLTSFRPWPREPGQLYDNFLEHLGRSDAMFAQIGVHGNNKLYGVPWPVRWNNAQHLEDHVFIFGIDQTTGRLTPMGFANFQGGSAAFSLVATSKRRPVSLHDIRRLYPLKA